MGEQVLLFLHIPKTAGSSVLPLLYEQYASPDYSVAEGGYLCAGVYYYPGTGFFKRPGGGTPPEVIEVLRRHPVRAVVGHFCFGIHRYVDAQSTYMTTLRHPVDRVVSLYYHMQRWRRGSKAWYPGGSPIPFTTETTLEQFVTDYQLRELDNDQTRRISGIEPPFGGCTQELLVRAKENLSSHFAAVGQMERLEESLLVAAETLGWTGTPVACRRLINEKRLPTAAISGEAREAILARNQLDLELHTFVGELLEEKVKALGKSLGQRLMGQ
jgi:Sulfotransferase family